MSLNKNNCASLTLACFDFLCLQQTYEMLVNVRNIKYLIAYKVNKKEQWSTFWLFNWGKPKSY